MEKIKKQFVLLLISILLLLYFREDILHMLNWSYRDMYHKELKDDEIDKIKYKLNIEEIQYQWTNGLTYENKPEILIYHHTAIKSITPEEVHLLHKSKGWEGIGYHYYITKDGTIFTGRPEKASGAHTIGNNNISLGICVEGNLEEEYLTEEQKKAIVDLSIYLCLKYDIYDIVGHRDRSNTLCPGANFPMDEIRTSVVKGVKEFK